MHKYTFLLLKNCKNRPELGVLSPDLSCLWQLGSSPPNLQWPQVAGGSASLN